MPCRISNRHDLPSHANVSGNVEKHRVWAKFANSDIVHYSLLPPYQPASRSQDASVRCRICGLDEALICRFSTHNCSLHLRRGHVKHGLQHAGQFRWPLGQRRASINLGLFDDKITLRIRLTNNEILVPILSILYPERYCDFWRGVGRFLRTYDLEELDERLNSTMPPWEDEWIQHPKKSSLKHWL